jgi:hypothetical protein
MPIRRAAGAYLGKTPPLPAKSHLPAKVQLPAKIPLPTNLPLPASLHSHLSI